MEKLKKPKTRNWVAVHMQQTSSGYHTEKRYSRKQKHKTTDSDPSLSVFRKDIKGCVGIYAALASSHP